ncbi:N-acetyltransferase [candidate division KSB1 bacterium]|nr:N-acetyltransferase [candidate division KSB1 bacterium]
MMLRKAKIKDVPNIIQLINQYAANGEMLARSRIQLYNSLRDFMVIEENNTIIGCGALNIVWEDIAEIRSLAITPDQIGKGYGREIVEYFLQEARDLELPTVFTLTYKPGFFEKLGFQIVDKKELPHKVWKDCINCPHFPDCDEIAMIRNLK